MVACSLLRGDDAPCTSKLSSSSSNSTPPISIEPSLLILEKRVRVGMSLLQENSGSHDPRPAVTEEEAEHRGQSEGAERVRRAMWSDSMLFSSQHASQLHDGVGAWEGADL